MNSKIPDKAKVWLDPTLAAVQDQLLTTKVSTKSAREESVKHERASEVMGRGSSLGADEGVSQLYQDQYHSLVRVVWLLLGDEGAAEEVVQEAFVRVYVAWHRIRDMTRTGSYLRSVALNLARSRLRRRRLEQFRAQFVAVRPRSAEDRLIESEDQDLVRQSLRMLPRRQRECLVLRYYLDLREEEIAEVLEISPGSVKTHIHRGLTKLATKVGAGS